VDERLKKRLQGETLQNVEGESSDLSGYSDAGVEGTATTRAVRPCQFTPTTYYQFMRRQKRMKGISRIDQQEKHNHGFFVRLKRRGKVHSAFFADKSNGGRPAALRAARKHYQKLLKQFGPLK
jgi:hypothetical protein